MKIVKEFKAFIKRGNVLDLAVAVVIGAAFTAIINSLANDIIMPPISLLLSGIGLKELKLILRPADADAGITEIAIGYGNFIQAILNFFIIAFFVFLFVKVITGYKSQLDKIKDKMQKDIDKLLKNKKLTEEQKAAEIEKIKAAAAPASAPEEKKETQEQLLAEIRDLLKSSVKEDLQNKGDTAPGAPGIKVKPQIKE